MSKWQLLRPSIISATLVLTGCVDTGQATAQQPCEQLEGLSFSRQSISLPTKGVSVKSAALVQLKTQAAGQTDKICRVSGEIASVDPAAPPIQFEVSLPEAWNGKAIAYGGGGFDGAIPATSGPHAMALPGDSVPVAQGYMVFGSDSGHGPTGETRIPATDGGFALNEEALRNYTGDALKKTYDAAMLIAQSRYGAAPASTYFIGGSNGGKEGLLAVQRWPDDYDGAIVVYPWRSAGTTVLTYGRITRALNKPGAYLAPKSQALLADAVMNACDHLDGLEDGVISNIDDCSFDPKTIACSGTVSTDCLTSAQIEMLRVYAEPYEFDYLDGGDSAYPGFPVLQGADLRGVQQLNSQAPVFPATEGMPTISELWGQFVRYFIAQDGDFGVLGYDPEAPSEYLDRTKEVVGLMNVPVTDFAEFRARGGKLIVLHGLSDALVSHRSTNLMWEQMGKDMGAEDRALFARYYTVPGYGHGQAGQNAFHAGWDSLSALDAWVALGVEPESPVVTDTGKVAMGRERPLCQYPSWPRFVSGDPNKAESFECSNS